MNRGTLIALGLGAATLAFVYTRRRPAATNGGAANVPTGGFPEQGSGSPSAPPIIPGFPPGVIILPGGQIAVPLSPIQSQLIDEYRRVLAEAQRNPSGANPQAMGVLADRLAAANLMTEQSTLRELARSIAAARAFPPPGGPPLGGGGAPGPVCLDGLPPGPDGTCYRYKK